MIGTTTLKYRWTVENAAKRDLGLRPLVWLIVVLSLVVGRPYAGAQSAASSKSKAQAPEKATPTKSTKVEKDDEATVDDNGDEDDDDAEESTAAADDNETKETLDTEKAAQEEEKLADDEEEVSEPPTEDVAEEPTPKKDPEPIPPPPKEEPAPIPVAKPTPRPEPIPEPQVQEVPEAAPSAADMVEVIPREKTVELEPRKKYTNYRERRTTHGFLFNINMENLYFPDYASLIDGQLYESMFGQEDVTLVQLQMGYKFNFALGSLTTGAGFGQGTLVDDRLVVNSVNVERELTIQKTSLHMQWQLDSLLKEPYFVPYVGASYWQMSLSEVQKTTNKLEASKDTGYGTALTVGFLVQLNWMDSDAARVAYMGHGLENTYLDVFWTQYQNTDDEEDPALENDFNFGVGLRLEF